MTEPLSLLVIGYGNSLRRDDGAGLLLAERLAACWREAGIDVQLILTQQLMPEMAEEIAAQPISHVIFVDTRVAESADPDVEISLIRPNAVEQSLGHQMEPSVMLSYAERLYGRAPTACMITIPGVDFGFGDELSDDVRRALDTSDEIALRTMARFAPA